jgi:hypothetical protein
MQQPFAANPPAGAERRRHYRVSVPAGSALQVRVWRLAPGVPLTHRPMPSQILAVETRQVSGEGLTISLRGKGGEPPRVTATDRLRIEIQYEDRTALLEGRLREPESRPADDAAFPAGIRIHGRPTDHAHREALSALAAIVGKLQREELRARTQAPQPDRAAA